MKAQLSLIEALSSGVIIMVALTAIGYEFYGMNYNALKTNYEAVFDINALFMKNASLRTCVQEGLYSEKCNLIIKELIRSYSIKELEISMNGNSHYFGHGSVCDYYRYCSAVAYNNSVSYLCINMCGG